MLTKTLFIIKNLMLFIVYLFSCGIGRCQISEPNGNKSANNSSANNNNGNTSKEDIGNGGFLIAIADRVLFTCDEAGNQKHRILCINCDSNRNANPITTKREGEIEETITDGKLVFYPNPVKQELYIDFDLSNPTKKVDAVVVYTLTGQIIKNYNNISNQSSLVIPFESLSQGIYIVNVNYNTGEIIDLKIKKQ